MERKNKKIVAGMMAGFCVLSTQSVLGNFSKLPMRGGNGLISYATGDDNNGFLVINGRHRLMMGFDGCWYSRNEDQGVTLLEYTPRFGSNSATVPGYIFDENGNKLYVTKVASNAFRWFRDLGITMNFLTIEGIRTVIEDGALDGFNNIQFIYIQQNARCREYIERLNINDVAIEYREYVDLE